MRTASLDVRLRRRLSWVGEALESACGICGERYSDIAAPVARRADALGSDESRTRDASELHEPSHVPDLHIDGRLRRGAEPEPREPDRRGRHAAARMGLQDRVL